MFYNRENTSNHLKLYIFSSKIDKITNFLLLYIKLNLNVSNFLRTLIVLKKLEVGILLTVKTIQF